jgi:hypothetical protein
LTGSARALLPLERGLGVLGLLVAAACLAALRWAPGALGPAGLLLGAALGLALAWDPLRWRPLALPLGLALLGHGWGGSWALAPLGLGLLTLGLACARARGARLP